MPEPPLVKFVGDAVDGLLGWVELEVRLCLQVRVEGLDFVDALGQGVAVTTADLPVNLRNSVQLFGRLCRHLRCWSKDSPRGGFEHKFLDSLCIVKISREIFILFYSNFA